MRFSYSVQAVLCFLLSSPLPAAGALEFVDKWGNSGSGNGQFASPSGVAIDAQGQVYVVDTENHRVQKFGGDGTYLLSWGVLGTGNGEFMFPRGIAMDGSGNVLVADTDNDRVQRFTPDGAYVGQWGSPGTGDGQFLSPRSVAVDGAGFIFVTEDAFASKRVQKFTAAGTFVSQWGSTGTGDGQFRGPRGIAVDDAGFVYVTDTLNDRIQKFTNTGTYVTQWGTNGSGPGQFILPIGVCVSGSHVFVVDQNNHRVEQFTLTGAFVSQLGTQCQLGTGTGCVDPDGAGPDELGDGQFNAPLAVGVDRFGFLYVADTANERVQKFGDPGVVGLPEAGVRGRLVVSPNPFRVQTRIAFSVDEASSGSTVVVRILDVTGREMRHLWEGRLSAGDQEVLWNGATDAGDQVPRGLYFAVIERPGTAPRAVKIVRLF